MFDVTYQFDIQGTYLKEMFLYYILTKQNTLEYHQL